MPYCPDCGTEIEGTHSFCPSCGSDLGTSDRGEERSTGTSASREPTSTANRFSTGQKVMLAGAGLVALGALLPWLQGEVLGTVVSMNGIEGDGVITLVLGLLAGGLGLFRWGKIARFSVAFIGAIVLIFGLVYISDPLIGAEFPTQQAEEIAKQAISPAIGLYLTAAGGLAILAGPVVDYTR